MKKIPEGVKVTIMGREFSVACQNDQREALSQAAIFLDEKMREIQQSGKVIGVEKCAIMAALNITHEMLSMQTQRGESDQLGTTVFEILEKIDVAMREQQQVTM